MCGAKERKKKRQAQTSVAYTGTCSFSHAYSDERRQYLCHMEVKDTILGKKEQKINARGRQSQLEIGEQLRGILENKFFSIYIQVQSQTREIPKCQKHTRKLKVNSCMEATAKDYERGCVYLF